MKKAPKYTALVIARKTGYVCAKTGDYLAIQPTDMQALMDAGKLMAEQKYIFIELYENMGEIAANTVNAVVDQLYNSGKYPLDAVLYFTRKNGKLYVSHPVGATFSIF